MKHCQRHGPEKDPYCVDCWKDERERDALCPSDATTCSPSSLTRETDAMVAADQHHLEDDNFFPATVYWRMCDLARTLERERDSWRGKAVDLHARHKNALEDIEAEIAERNEAREIAAEACAMLAENGFETNYPPMPWDSDSPENTLL